MKKTKFTEAQIVFAIKQAETGTPVWRIRSGNKEKASLQIIDVAGKVIETKEGLLPNQNVAVGGNLKAGVYFIKIKQGASTTELKIVKQPH